MDFIQFFGKTTRISCSKVACENFVTVQSGDARWGALALTDMEETRAASPSYVLGLFKRSAERSSFLQGLLCKGEVSALSRERCKHRCFMDAEIVRTLNLLYIIMYILTQNFCCMSWCESVVPWPTMFSGNSPHT